MCDSSSSTTEARSHGENPLLEKNLPYGGHRFKVPLCLRASVVSNTIA